MVCLLSPAVAVAILRNCIGTASRQQSTTSEAALEPFAVVGKTIPRIDGPAKVTGEARFAADIDLPGLLWGKILRSPLPHAKIVSIDLSKALSLPGVLAGVSGRDFPTVRTGKNIKDMPVLCSDVVRFIGDPIAAIAAETADVAERGHEPDRGRVRGAANGHRSADGDG